MDALRVADGERVALKSVRKSEHPFEVEITQYLNTPDLLADKRNRCTRIIELLSVPNTDETIMVMPLLREWDVPPLRSVGEAAHFFTQIAEVCTPAFFY